MAEAQASAQAHVRLTLFADLKRYLPKDENEPLNFHVEPGTTVRMLLAQAGIPASEEITVGLNGNQGDRDSILKDGDEVVLFSPMEGG